MRAPSMAPGKPGFERIKWCFENTLITVFPMVLASVDDQGKSALWQRGKTIFMMAVILTRI